MSRAVICDVCGGSEKIPERTTMVGDIHPDLPEAWLRLHSTAEGGPQESADVCSSTCAGEWAAMAAVAASPRARRSPLNPKDEA